MNLVIVGATGLVGRTMIDVLIERGFNFSDLILAASSRSAGKQLHFADKSGIVISLDEALVKGPGIALFSAGSDVSREWAPRFAENGVTVIDNSSAWRRNPEIPLVVPEVNGHVLRQDASIIANPNCSTIQMVMALAPLHKAYGISRIVVSTYQSVTGSGRKGVEQLMAEEAGKPVTKVYPHQIYNNLLPHGGDFNTDGYSAEEEKLIFETRKILGDQQIEISPTVVRVPVTGGHSESLNIILKSSPTLEEVRKSISDFKGITLQDDPSNAIYPMPLNAEGKDDVFVGRVRKDPFNSSAINMWVVSDNLRKGAATNAVQIAEYLIEHSLF